MGEETLERFIEIDESYPLEDLGDESRVKEVQYGMLVSSDVHVHRKPSLRDFRIEHPFRILRIEVSEEIEGGVHEVIHDFRVAFRIPSAAWAHGLVELGYVRERGISVSLRLPIFDFGQSHREILLLLRDDPARVTVYHRNRGSPISLPGNAPIPQLVAHVRSSDSSTGQGFVELRDRLVLGETVVSWGIDDRATPFLVHRNHLDTVFQCEFHIPFVVRRHSHDGSGPVFRKDVVCDEDGDFLAAERIDGFHSGEDSGLLLLFPGSGLLLDHLLKLRLPAFRNVLLGKLRVGSDRHEGDSEDCIDAGREDLDLILRSLHCEFRRGSAFSIYPIALCRLGFRRPIDGVEIRIQLFREIGDPEEPLLQFPFLDFRVSMPFAFPVDHLLVGDHRHAVGAPVDSRFLLVGKPLLDHLQEYPLIPPIIFGRGGVDLVVPVEERSELLELVVLEVPDVIGDQGLRVDIPLHREIFRMDSECIESHRLEHVVSGHLHHPSVGIRSREGIEIPDM